MWNKRSFLLKIRVKLRDEGKRFGFFLLLSLLPLHHLLLSCDAAMGMLRGRAQAAWLAMNAVHGALLGIMAIEPQEYAHIEVQDKKRQNVYVDIRTLGLGFTNVEADTPSVAGGRAPGRTATGRRMADVPYGLAFFARFIACGAALLLALPLFPGTGTVSAALWGSMLLTVFYTLVRPLLLTLLLPFNLFLVGLLTPLADALLVLWAGAWVNGLAFSYWQGVAVALLVSLLYMPYSYWKQKSLWAIG